MDKNLLLAYRIIDIDNYKYFVVIPPPTKNQIKKANFDYSKYLNGLINHLIKTPQKERTKLLHKWASLEKTKQCDILLGQIQIEYEQALKLGENEEDLSSVYTKKMKQVIKENKSNHEEFVDEQKDVSLKERFKKIQTTSKRRFNSFLEGKEEVSNLYLYDLTQMNMNSAQRQFKRNFFAHLNMGIQDELTELELEMMTLGEIWEYNKCYLERKKQKDSKRKIKKKT